MQIISALSIENWIHIIAIALQCSGAILLINTNFSSKRDKLIVAYVNSSVLVTRDDDKQTVQHKSMGLKDFYKQHGINKISVIYILTGTIIATWGRAYFGDGQYFQVIIFILLLAILFYAPKKMIALLEKYKERKEPNYFTITINDLVTLNLEADVNVITNADIDKIIV